MSNLKSVPQVLERRRTRRWIKVIEADEVHDCPAMELNIGYVDTKLAEAFQKMMRNNKGLDSVEDKKFKDFKRKVLSDLMDVKSWDEDGDVKLWRGVTTRNLQRVCPVFMTNPELLPDPDEFDPTQEWVFDAEDLSVISQEIEPARFMALLEESQNLDEYAKEGFEQAKKS